jgi:hypothetical protein
MKKSIFLAVILISVFSSCKKGNNAASGGSWTFKNQTYSASFCNYILGALTAQTGASDPTGSLALYFPDTIPVAGTYTVTNQFSFPPAQGYVFIQVTDSATTNFWQIKNNNSAQVTVTLSSAGLPSVTIPPMMLINHNSAAPVGAPNNTDSSLVSGTITLTPL